jgi:uncharacterized protein YjlB
MQRGAADQTVEQRIRSLPLPARDPLFGNEGPMKRYAVQR